MNHYHPLNTLQAENSCKVAQPDPHNLHHTLLHYIQMNSFAYLNLADHNHPTHILQHLKAIVASAHKQEAFVFEKELHSLTHIQAGSHKQQLGMLGAAVRILVEVDSLPDSDSVLEPSHSVLLEMHHN